MQGPEYLAIEREVGSEVRIIPLDAGPHVSANIHEWHGDSRGHCEGDTLVVETTNFRPEAAYRNSNPKTLKIYRALHADRQGYYRVQIHGR